MNNIRINETKRAIEVTKAFANKASRYGTTEYNELQAVRRDYPDFKVITKSAGKRKGTFKGLTITYMKEYIEKHDGENSENMKDYCILCGRNEKWEIVDLTRMVTYGEIKAWFLKKYPVFNEYAKRANEVLKAV